MSNTLGVENGISFDGIHSYSDFGMYLASRPDLGSTKPKTNTVEVPGMDGLLDMTEANSGEVKFSNRTMVFSFWKKVDIPDQAEFMAGVTTALHGKQIKKIVLDEDPAWYYSGRATVAFPSSKRKTWRMQCVVTVDAAPYAMKLEETVVDLHPDGGEWGELDIVLPGVDKAATEKNTALWFGTKLFPELNLVAFRFDMETLTLRWSQDAPHTSSNRFFQIADADGNAYTSGSISQSVFDLGFTTISLSTLVQAGVNIEKIYAITVIGIGGVTACVKQVSQTIVVQNSRKNVVPEFDLSTSGESTEVTVNGVPFTILPGANKYDDISLKSGENEIIIPYDLDVESLTMTFREGRL